MPLASAIGQNNPSSEETLAVSSSMSTLRRVIGGRAADFDLQWIPPSNGHAVYEIAATGGRVRVNGSTGMAICRGAYLYLRNRCNAMVTWSGRNLNLPEKFPDAPGQRVVCPYRFTQYLNVCTFGYSTPFWNWQRWERELDWMALHGINMALALTGQEEIWRRVWKNMGVTSAELDRFSVGPAYLPWHWMGNINRFDGPLSPEWIARQCELQKMILQRMRELGITPIVPAFSGFVPQAFKRVYRSAKISALLWGHQSDIPLETKTFLLHPDESALYTEISRSFIEEYKQEYGEVEYYLADLFNEMEPPVNSRRRYQDLARFARNVYSGITAGDANGKWVMQGWMFFKSPEFWDKPSIEAFLSEIPNDRLIIIDYTSDLKSDREPVWKTSHAFFGKQWMNGMLQNFGGNNNLWGNLRELATRPAAVLKDPDRGNLAGWALCPEGIETNEVVFELLTDLGWSATAVDIESWIPSYCRSRYGAYPNAMDEAWKLLLQSAYGPGAESLGRHFSWQRRPTLEPELIKIDPAFRIAGKKFLPCAGELSSSILYQNDLIELAAQSLALMVDEKLKSACEAFKAGQMPAHKQMAEEGFEMLMQMDAILNTRPDRRLQSWVGAARQCAQRADQALFLDSEARALLTFWGWSDLYDYAARVWAGLIRDYYVNRWRNFFEGLQQKPAPYLDEWEQTWISEPYTPSAARPITDLVDQIRQMLTAS
jgi:alpha-N-acetylglucosaminidase